MRPFRRRNVIPAAVLSSILAFGGILHAQEKEKQNPGAKKEEARKNPSHRDRVAPGARAERAQPTKPRPPAANESTFLGVAAENVGPAVRAQLDLPAGTGIGVGEVLKDSPADKAGIKQFDILTKLDDQILVSGEQLQTLVRMMKPGDEVTLTLLRAMKEQTVKVKLGSHRLAATGTPSRGHNVEPWRQRGGTPPAWDQHSWQEHWKQFGDQFGKGMNEWMEKYGKEWEGNLRNFLDENFGDPDTWEPKIEKWLDEGVRPRIETHVRNFANVHATIVDDDGKIEITTKDGRKHVTATDPDGKVLFDGFCETDAERKKVPKNILKKVDGVKFDIRISPPAEMKKRPPTPERPAPKARGSAAGGTA